MQAVLDTLMTHPQVVMSHFQGFLSHRAGQENLPNLWLCGWWFLIVYLSLTHYPGKSPCPPFIHHLSVTYRDHLLKLNEFYWRWRKCAASLPVSQNDIERPLLFNLATLTDVCHWGKESLRAPAISDSLSNAATIKQFLKPHGISFQSRNIFHLSRYENMILQRIAYYLAIGNWWGTWRLETCWACLNTIRQLGAGDPLFWLFHATGQLVQPVTDLFLSSHPRISKGQPKYKSTRII